MQFKFRNKNDLSFYNIILSTALYAMLVVYPLCDQLLIIIYEFREKMHHEKKKRLAWYLRPYSFY